MEATLLMATHETRRDLSGKSVPLPLVDVLGESYLTVLVKRLAHIPNLRRIHIVTNEVLRERIEQWSQSVESNIRPSITSDGTRSEEERFGAINDLELLVEEQKIDDDILVVGGHTWFTYDLADFVRKAEQRAPAVLVTNIEPGSRPSRFGWCKLDVDGRVVEFLEHPHESPEDTYKASCVYFFRKDDLQRLKEFSSQATSRTTPGDFVQWLASKVPTYGIKECSFWDAEHPDQAGTFSGADYLSWRDFVRLAASPMYSTWEKSAAAQLEHVSSHRDLLKALQDKGDDNLRIVAARLLGHSQSLLSDDALQNVVHALVDALSDRGNNDVGTMHGGDEGDIYYVAATAAESLAKLGYASSREAVFERASLEQVEIVPERMRKNVVF